MMQEMHSAASQAWVEMYEVIMLFQWSEAQVWWPLLCFDFTATAPMDKMDNPIDCNVTHWFLQNLKHLCPIQCCHKILTVFLLLCIQGPLVENAVACLVEMLHIMLLNNRYTAVYWFTYFEFMTKSFKLRSLIQVCETFLVSNPRSMWNITCIAFMGWHNNV
jgi:hypothetical protein